MATFTIAASDSTQQNIASASYACDGTDDHATINSAIESLPAGGGRIFLHEGTYVVTDSIISKSNLWLSGSGNGTIITVPDGSGGGFELISGRTNGSNVDVTISDLTLDGNAADGIHPIYFSTSPDATVCDGLVVRDCAIQNCAGTSYGVLTVGATRVRITGNRFFELADSCIELRETFGCVVSNNDFYRGSLQFYAADAIGVGSGDFVISNNVMYGCTVVVADDGGVIDGFVFKGNSWRPGGEGVGDSAGQTIHFRVTENLVISGNRFDATVDDAANNPLILLDTTVSNVVVSDNVIIAGYLHATGVGYGGISCEADDVSIIGNLIVAPGNGTYGIKSTSAVGLRVQGNKIVLDTGSTTTNGVDIAGTVDADIAANTIIDAVIGVEVAVTSADTMIIDNRYVDCGTGTDNSDAAATVREL